MLMPKASVHEDNGPTPWKYKVRTAGQVAPMEAKTVAMPMR